MGVLFTKKVSCPWQLFICFIQNSGVFNKGNLAPEPPRDTWQCLQTVVGATVGRGAVTIYGVGWRPDVLLNSP